jgi:hypothetical protein
LRRSPAARLMGSRRRSMSSLFRRAPRPLSRRAAAGQRARAVRARRAARASPAFAHSQRQRSRLPPDSSWDSRSSSSTTTHIFAPMSARLCMDTTAGSRASRDANRGGPASERLLTRENWIVRLASDGLPGLTSDTVESWFDHERTLKVLFGNATRKRRAISPAPLLWIGDDGRAWNPLIIKSQ